MHGQVVMIYYQLCEKVWGGRLATEQIYGGLESVELIPDAHMLSSSTTVSIDGVFSSGNPPIGELPVPDETDNTDGNSYKGNNEEDSGTSMQAIVRQRHKFLDGKLKNYRHDKMKRKLAEDTQLLRHAQEELQIKKE